MRPRGRFDAHHATELLNSVGLGNRLDHRPAELSGGEQQRVALARAVVNDPPLLFADEPTGNLDDASAQLVLDLLLEFARGGNRTLVLASHDPRAWELADRALDIDGGQLLDPARRDP
jgi:putative ABC transport system ATP-binding protein